MALGKFTKSKKLDLFENIHNFLFLEPVKSIKLKI